MQSKRVGYAASFSIAWMVVAVSIAQSGTVDEAEQSQPAQSQPAQSQPAQSQPAQSQPAQSQPVVTPTAIPTPTPTPTPPPTGLIEIEVQRRDDGETVPAVGAVVWVEGPPRSRRKVRDPTTLEARDKRFAPRVVSVPVGGTVDFPNHDRFYHNVFSLSETKAFDLGLYRRGKSASVEFDKPGVVKVYCNIHPKMAAYVLVVDSDFHAQTGADGMAKIGGLPIGKWTVHLWDEKGGDHQLEASVAGNQTSRLKHLFDVSEFREEEHKNKFGEEYPSPDDEESRY